MVDPIELVLNFFERCAHSKAEMAAAFRDLFDEATVWENVGVAQTTGIEEALRFMDVLEADLGIATFDARMITIAANGNHVLTERLDVLLGPGGDQVVSLRLMGVLEIEGGKIRSWRDYFDTAALSAAREARASPAR